jgi:hypothetical protein
MSANAFTPTIFTVIANATMFASQIAAARQARSTLDAVVTKSRAAALETLAALTPVLARTFATAWKANVFPHAVCTLFVYFDSFRSSHGWA